MNITIKGIRNAGDLSQERIVLTVSASTDVGRYMLVAGEYVKKDLVSNMVRQSFWFPDKPIKPSDLVIIYTKKGIANEKTNESGITSHFFYWGLSTPIWDSDGAAAVLMRIAEWEAKSVEE